LVSLNDRSLQEIAESFDYGQRERRPVMSPSPDGHFADAERAGGGRVATKGDFEDEIMPAGGELALEARSYEIGTAQHDHSRKLVMQTPPCILTVL
jgi:hypothetical protein